MKTMIVRLNGQESVEVGSLEAASRAVRRYCDRNDLGASDYYRHPQAGNVYDRETGRQVAHISYNGRCWDRR